MTLGQKTEMWRSRQPRTICALFLLTPPLATIAKSFQQFDSRASDQDPRSLNPGQAIDDELANGERQPQYSGLVLTLDDDTREDGLLQVYEIFNLKLQADLVVLSACQTGLGRQFKGEGIIGLTRAFMYAGAPSVVVSLWRVADASTAELMVGFYQQLNRGGDKAEAIRHAKLDLMRNPRYSHPYYWAPFVLVGETRQ